MSYKEWVNLYKSMHDLLKFSNWKAQLTNEADPSYVAFVAIDRAWDLFDRGKNLPPFGYLPTIYENIVENVEKLLPSDIDTQLMLCKEICQQSDNKMQEKVKLQIISKVDDILKQLRNFRTRVPELKKLRNFGIRVRELGKVSRSNVYLVQTNFSINL
jgi:hypothetical protein